MFMKETTFMIVARLDVKNEHSSLVPISTPITIFNEDRFNNIAAVISKLGYDIVVIPKNIKE